MDQAQGAALMADVAAVVTSFDPDQRLVEAVSSVLGQVGRVVVVDDGSPHPERAAETLASVAALGARVVRIPENRGIAAAFNAGLSLLEEDPPAWVLTLDQDSVLPSGYVAAVRSAGARALAARLPVGMVAPENAESVRGDSGRDSGVAGVLLGGEPISSGLLVPWSTHETVGRYDEGLFIDGVDTDFWLRTVEAGLVVVTAPGARLKHRLGRAHRVRLGPWSHSQTVASTFRYYYQLRNLVVLVRRHGRRQPAWALRAIAAQGGHLILVSVLVPGRVGRLREAVAGWRDGWMGRTGRRP